MVHVKKARGGPGDEDLRCVPRLPIDPKGKATKKTTSKKHKYPDAEIARAAAVAEAIESAKRGGARSGVVIADQLTPAQRIAVEQVERRYGNPARTTMVGGRRLVLEETQP